MMCIGLGLCRLLRRSTAAAISMLAVAALPAAAQSARPIDVRGEVFVGSDIERYLRELQVAGAAPLYPVTVRSPATRDLDRMLPADSAHPWAGRYRLAGDSARGLQLRAVRPRAQLLFNSAFPYGSNDAALWAGRGLTTSVEGGFHAEWGALSLTVAPIAFVAQNAEFDLQDNREAGALAYADGRFPRNIDHPQRFGDGSYVRVDPGQSTLRLDLAGVAAGISTANQQWGPASDNPLLLGNNAGGMPHVFLGTSRPANIWVGRVHGRIMWAAPQQTDWSPETEADGRRFTAGLVATFSPRGAPGVELGFARIFHSLWPEDGLSADELVAPLEGVFKAGLSGDSEIAGSNQLASVFARWAHPRAGVELWGEFARDDHNNDVRDFVLQPDHDSGYLIGGRKVWRTAERLTSLRAEVLNARITHLARVRTQTPLYLHSGVRQGHTQLGQVLGSPGAFAGLSSIVAVDRYDRGGRWSAAWTQLLQDASGAQLGDARAPDGTDVTHALGVERLFFRGRFDITAGGTAAYQLNRNFAGDALNLNLTLRVSRGF